MVTSQPAERVSASARGGVARQKTSHTSKIESATASVSRLTTSFRNLQASVKDLRVQNDRLVRETSNSYFSKTLFAGTTLFRK